MGMLVHFSLHLDSLNRFLLVRVNHSNVLVNHLFYYRFANWYIRVENYIDQSTKNGLPTKWTDLVTIILPICVCAQHIKYHMHTYMCVMCMAVLALNGIWYPFLCMLREFFAALFMTVLNIVEVINVESFNKILRWCFQSLLEVGKRAQKMNAMQRKKENKRTKTNFA